MTTSMTNLEPTTPEPNAASDNKDNDQKEEK